MATQTLVDNAKVVAKLYEAFNKGDIPYIMEHIAADCHWIGAGEGFLPEGGVYIGQDVQRFFQALSDNQNISDFEPQTIGNINDHEVAAFGTITSASKKTGKSLTSNWAMHWKFNDFGKVVYFQDFFDTAAAWQADQE